MILDIDQVGKLEYKINGSEVIGTLNGTKLNNATHSIEADNDNKDRRDEAQHHVILPINGKYSIHIILRNIEGMNNETRIAA
jgi:hypothetical protein